MNGIVKMRDLDFDKSLFKNYLTGTVLDDLLCSYRGLPKGVNYMIIGDPGVGKTTIILDMIANIGIAYPQLKILFVSAEMNQIDLAVYVQRFPKFGDIDILFIDSNFEEETHNWETMRDALSEGWDIVDVDSFYELQGIIKEEESITLKKAESLLLSLIKKHNLGSNKLKKIRRSLQYNK
jgi:predicted ATP-dependent serine protease